MSIEFKGSTQLNVTAPEVFVWSVLPRRHDDQKNKDLTGFAFEHSLSSSHPSHEGNNLKSKSSSNYEGESGSHSWWPSTSFRLQSITSVNLLFGLIFNLLGVFVVIKETRKEPAIHQRPESLNPSRAVRCFQGLITQFQFDSLNILHTNRRLMW